MSVKKVIQTHCDRCDKIIDDPPVRDAEDEHPLYVAGAIVEPPIDFTDLCVKCTARIQTLLGQIRLDEPAKKDDAKPPVGDNAAFPKADASAPTAT